MPVYAVVVAAGKGKRFKGKKQFISIDGKPLFAYSLDVFEKNPLVHSIVLVVRKEDITRTRRAVERFRYKKVSAIVAGGKRRQDSVRNGVGAILPGVRTGSAVVVHDAARPFFSSALLTAGIRLCRRHRCVVPGVPVRDTIKHSRTGLVLKTIPRDGLYQIQTPQFFDLKLLLSAYEAVKFSDDFTDEASIIEAFGAPVHIMAGSRVNMKITDREDMDIVRRLIGPR